MLNAEQAADLQFQVTPGAGVEAKRVTVTVDGRSVKAVPSGKGLAVRPEKLADGRHVLQVSVARSGPFGKAGGTRRTFSVDSTAPVLELPETMTAPSLRGAFTVKGTSSGASAVTVNGTAAKLTGKTFTVELPSPPATVEVVATDKAGNVVRDEVAVSVRHPGMRAVHITALGWTASSLREPILRLARQGRIDAIQLDIKDEDGIVGYDSKVPLARRLHAAKGYYDARKVLDELHAHGRARRRSHRGLPRPEARPVGLAARAPRLGHPDPRRQGVRRALRQLRVHEPVQRRGAPVQHRPGDRGGEAGLRRHPLRLRAPARREAQRLPLRGPDGHARSRPSSASSRTAARRCGPKGAFLGASVYGIAATRPTEIAQDIAGMAQYADYIAPMVYPSHWGRGEYGVSNPNKQPHLIVKRSLADFARIDQGHQQRRSCRGCRTSPWA